MPPLPELLSSGSEGVCTVSRRWTVDTEVVRRVMRAATQFELETGRPVRIISGHRSIGKQLELKRRGRPAADPSVSTHTSCPSTGVDVSMGFGITNVMKVIWGRIIVFEGLRWGGGSCIDRTTGIPKDWNHVDAGPRSGGATITRPC